ncbi:MAG: sulfatase-like hydrolase/transferase, partial [Candidatus Hydrogenedentales bacterium]
MKLINVKYQLVVLAVTCLLLPTWPAAAAPNILLIIADDHAPYVMGAYGNANAQTPNLDRLARDGMRFDRAYCTSPVCTASRQSLLTGRYPRSIGVTQLRTPLPAAEVTLAESLRDAGYRTGAIGKMHFNSDLRHGFDTRVDLPEHLLYLDTRPADALPPGLAVLPPWRPFRDPAAVWLNAGALPYGATERQMPGTWFAAEAGRFIREFDDKPFFLVVSFYEPHSPYHFPVEYAGKFDPDSFEAPNVAEPDRWQVPVIFEGLTDAEKRGIAAAYYTSAAFMDQNVGRVLDALDADGHRDNTLVIYIGDHGYFLGQHGRFEKHAMYE